MILESLVNNHVDNVERLWVFNPNIIPGVSGRLDDDYLVHKLEQGCLADLENCHIKEEVIIIIIIIAKLSNCRGD